MSEEGLITTEPLVIKDRNKQELSLHQCLIAGGMAGTAVDTALFPLDTIKTRLQSKAGFRASGGFKGVYSGLSSAIIGSAPSSAIFFVCYENVKFALSQNKNISENYSPFIHMVAASCGEVGACLVRVPTEVVKQRLQAKHYNSLYLALTNIYKTEGLMGFYRGYLSTVVREIPFTCIQFPVYEFLKKRYSQYKKQESILPWEAAVAGSIAGGLSAAVTTPLDVVKTRLMLSSKVEATVGVSGCNGGGGSANYAGVLPTIKRIAKEEGVSALFKGVVPRTIWISIGGCIFLGAYEKAKSMFIDDQKH
ncbi:S-adenosylmethionine transporter [Mycoemilia scoparia]|uniref:S-adenosylmethionine transporter n=1 Tax=Mycoemilia scoparia TaxID=417184 RepID=A0A9W8A6K5_9FUNG|nr:S-adenosylmethionine transporter [Mycoemilia scoparia]